MSSESGKNKNGGSGLSKSDVDLWKSMTKDLDSYSDDVRYVEALLDERVAREKKKIQKEKRDVISTDARVQKKHSEKSREMDKRTEQRLRRGQIYIEDRLDLHGLRQQEAKTILIDFISKNYQRGRRCVLVITGKGGPKTQNDRSSIESGIQTGVLKKMTPEWLEAPEIKGYILRSVEALPKDGGSGALYVYLRKNKTI